MATKTIIAKKLAPKKVAVRSKEVVGKKQKPQPGSWAAIVTSVEFAKKAGLTYP